MEQPEPQVPHVVFLPIPALGHIKPMLYLAENLSHASFQVTFINTQHIHDRLLSTNMLARHPEFQFLTIPDGLPPDHPRSNPNSLGDVLMSVGAAIKPALREHLILLCKKNGLWQPATCIIEDGILSSCVIDVAEEFQIPVFAFRTSSACCIWTYFHLPKLIEEGDVPVLQDKDMDKPVTCIPGLENIVRRRDLPGIFRIERANDPGLEFFMNDQTIVMPRAFAMIINSCDGLEAPMISKLGSIFPKMYAVGPLHGLSNTPVKDQTLASSKSILWKEDRGCMSWLDSQPSKSVVFVSFGSIIGLTRDKVLEFGHGLVNSGKPFLWVIRPESITGEADPSLTIGELKDMMEDNKGLIMSWIPQEEVLAHPAIGVFLTHSGWNSTLESIYAGVPMICWPVIGDQQINSRFVSDVWKIGLDMKDTCDRSKIGKMVRDLMEDKREEIMKSMDEITRKVRDGVKEGGSSYCNLEKLIEDIRSMT